MRRGSHHSTALTKHHQTLSLLSEGTRLSRKNSRLHDFVRSFSSYIVDFITQYKSLRGRTLLLQRIHRTIAHAASDHAWNWKVSSSKLWSMIKFKIHLRLKGSAYPSSIRRLVLHLINSHLPNFDRWSHRLDLRNDGFQNHEVINQQPTPLTSNNVVEANVKSRSSQGMSLKNNENEFPEEKDPLPKDNTPRNNLRLKQELINRRNEKKDFEPNAFNISSTVSRNDNTSVVCEEDLDSKLTEPPYENLTKR